MTTTTNEHNDDDDLLIWSSIVPNTFREDRGDIRRAGDPLLHPELGVYGSRTLYEGLRQGQSLNPLGPCLGFRAVSKTGLATPYIYSSYTECVARIDALAAGLETLKLVEPSSSKNDNDYDDEMTTLLGIYMKNCMEWVLSEHAVYCLGGATVPLYDTFGPDAVQFILQQTNCKTVVSTRAELENLCHAKQQQGNNSNSLDDFEFVILVDGVTPEAAKLATDANLQAISLAKVEAVGAHRIATQGPHKHHPPNPTDVATFCYTSGTTGDPKGALLTHQNIISVIVGMQRSLQLQAQLTDRHLSYLPLPHIFERLALTQCLLAGASVAFFRGDPALLIEDLQACRPTILPMAPRVLNRIYDKIHAGIAAAGGTKQKLFDKALETKTQNLLQHGRLKHILYDRLIFHKIKKGLGMDQLRFVISGSAPLADNVMIFFRCLLGIPVVEGYGQTEGAAGATIGHPDNVATVGHVGGPTGATEICLLDVPEMGYLHTDTEHRGQPCQGRGEICVRGPNVFKGYYKDEEKTRETVDDEGWLHSGDIGLWRPDGTLQIIDRKKNIFKLSQGEYVAPEKIENILTRSPLIAQCFVYGDSFQSSLVAIVVPDEEPVLAWASSKPDLANATFEELCRSSELKDAIMEDIQTLSRERGLHGFETVRAILIEPTPFSVEKDMMTPTFKLKRQQIRDAYEKEISDLYASIPPPRSKL